MKNTKKKVINFDVTTIAEVPFMDGIRRASYNWFLDLVTLIENREDLEIVPCRSFNYDFHVDYSMLSGSVDSQFLYGKDTTGAIKGDVLFIPAYDSFLHEKNVNFDQIASKQVIVSTIYDLIPFDHPEWFPSAETVNRFSEAIYKQCFYSSVIVVNTNHVRRRLMKQLDTWNMSRAGKKIVVIPLGGMQRGITGATVLANSGSSSKNYLVVGTIEPRKGISEILQNFIDVNPIESSISLTLVGRLGWSADNDLKLIKKCKREFPKNFSWLDRASDEELELSYLNADICLFGSYDEGFGLPLVEALDRGKICVARDIEPFKEISNQSVVTFGANGDFKNLSEAFLNFREVVELSEIKNKHYVQTTHEKSAELLLEILLQA